MSSNLTVGIAAAMQGVPCEVPSSGPINWLHAGEAAAAFMESVSRDGDDAPVHDLDGTCDTIKNGPAMLESLAPGRAVTRGGGPLTVPPDLSDAPIRAHLGDFPSVSPDQGFRDAFLAFGSLAAQGRLPPVA